MRLNSIPTLLVFRQNKTACFSLRFETSTVLCHSDVRAYYICCFAFEVNDS